MGKFLILMCGIMCLIHGFMRHKMVDEKQPRGAKLQQNKNKTDDKCVGVRVHTELWFAQERTIDTHPCQKVVTRAQASVFRERMCQHSEETN